LALSNNHSLTPYEVNTLKTSTQLYNVVSTRNNKLKVNKRSTMEVILVLDSGKS